MLSAGRYLLGVVELAVLVGFAWAGAAQVRRRLLPTFEGAPALLATSVLSLAILLWSAEALGTVSLFKPIPFILLVGAAGLALRFGVPVRQASAAGGGADACGLSLPSLAISLAIAGVCLGHFAAEARLRLGTGMTGFDSTWYHGTFAAGFYQSGNTIDLHYIAPQFLAWFYPANSEVVHAIGMLAFGRDLLSPLLNLGWVAGCLLACWCIGRPYRVGPWSLALGAVALSVPALADQGGEARNDVVGIFFLLAAVAVAVNARVGRSTAGGNELGPLLVVGLSAGLAAGTKLNFLLPAVVIVVGLAVIAPRGRRWRALGVAGMAVLAGGGYWYLRNLVHAGNPMPWIHHLGPIDLPSPGQTLGGREAHSILGYLTDGSVWSEWFLPGLHSGLWLIWPALGAAALAGLLLTLVPTRRGRAGRRDQDRPISAGLVPSTSEAGDSQRGLGRVDLALALAGVAGLATALAWIVAPTSASGPQGMPRGFESGLRYLAPALVLGLALLPATPPLRSLAARLATLGARSSFRTHRRRKDDRGGSGRDDGGSEGGADLVPRSWLIAVAAGLAVLAVIAGYPIQRHYLQNRYRDPTFTTPGLNAAFAWARNVSGARIATTSTRQYPLFGTDLSNHVAYVGTTQPHGGFEAAKTCREWRRLLNEGDYEYVVATRDRIEPGQSPYPPQARWTRSPQAKVVLEKPPTVVFRLNGPLDPAACPG